MPTPLDGAKRVANRDWITNELNLTLVILEGLAENQEHKKTSTREIMQEMDERKRKYLMAPFNRFEKYYSGARDASKFEAGYTTGEIMADPEAQKFIMGIEQRFTELEDYLRKLDTGESTEPLSEAHYLVARTREHLLESCREIQAENTEARTNRL